MPLRQLYWGEKPVFISMIPLFCKTFLIYFDKSIGL